MNFLDVYKKSSLNFTSPQRLTFDRALQKSIGKEWRYIRGFGYTHYIDLFDAMRWIGKRARTPKQFSRAHAYFLGPFLKSHPFFKKKVHYIVYRKKVNLTMEGFRYWCMEQRTTKAQLLKSRFSMMLGNISPGSNKENTPTKRMGNRKRRTNPEHLSDRSPKKMKFTSPTEELNKVIERLLAESDDLSDCKTQLEKKAEQLRRVYFIREIGTNCRYKIGITTRPLKERLAELQTGNPDDLEVYRSVVYHDPRELETFLHDMFSVQQIRNEWYKLTATRIDEIVDFMEGCASAPSPGT